MSELGPPPEALLIERLRTEARPRLSIRAAADAAGISDARWRQIAKGHNQASKDVRVPARAPADTLARMARVVGATAQQLREAGRGDAADELEAIPRQPTGMTPDEFVRAGRRTAANYLNASRSGAIEHVENRFWALGKQIDAAGRHLADGDVEGALSLLIAAGSLIESIINDLDTEGAHRVDSSPRTQEPPAQGQASEDEKNKADDLSRRRKPPRLDEPPAYPPAGIPVAADEGGPVGIPDVAAPGEHPEPVPEDAGEEPQD